MGIKIGIVGYGFMGHEHEAMFADMSEIDLIAVCDINEQQISKANEELCRYNNIDSMLENDDIQVILVAANNNQHKDIVCKAAHAGKDIICEKPVAMSVAELDEMVKVTKECGVKFTVHHQRRLDQDFRTAKAVYDSRTLGDVYTIKSSLYGYNGNMHDWHVYISEGGGMLYDWGVHLLDQLLWMVEGKITSIYADIRNIINDEVDDYFKILMKFDCDVTAEVELGTYYLSDKKDWFVRHWFMGGSKGSMYIDGFKPEGRIVRTQELLTNVAGLRTITAAGPTRSFGEPREGLILTEELPEVHTNHRQFFKNYAKAYNGEEEFMIQIPEVRRVLQLMEAIRQSGKTGEAIHFE